MDTQANSVIRVLIVEDDVTLRKAIRHVVNSGLNADCILAKNGNEAWDILLANTFDIIISDWNMPRKSGDELLFEVRSHDRTKNTPFLMLTSRSDKDSLITAMQAGVTDYVIKPFTPVVLLGKMHKLLNLRAVID